MDNMYKWKTFVEEIHKLAASEGDKYKSISLMNGISQRQLLYKNLREQTLIKKYALDLIRCSTQDTPKTKEEYVGF